MKKQHKKSKQQDDGKIQMNERINEDVLKRLKATSNELKAAEKQRQEEARQAERQRKLEKEKNKSFSELLEESNLDWKSFK